MNVFIIAALTADGFIGRDSQDRSTHWTSKEDATWFNRRSKEAGVMVLGSSTFKTFGEKPLPGRLHVVYTRDEAKLTQPRTDQVWYTKATPAETIAELAVAGFQEVAICGGAAIYTQFLLAGVVNKLYLTIEPVLFGQGIKLFTQELEPYLQLQLLERHILSEQTTVFEYLVSASSHQK